MVLPPERKTAIPRRFSPTITREYIRTCYKEVKKMMGSHDSRNVLMENGDGNVESVVRFVQLLSDKRGTKLKSRALAAYSVHIILLSVSARRRKWLIRTTHTLVGFLPVCCGNEQLEGERRGEDEELSVCGLTSLMKALMESDE